MVKFKRAMKKKAFKTRGIKKGPKGSAKITKIVKKVMRKEAEWNHLSRTQYFQFPNYTATTANLDAGFWGGVSIFPQPGSASTNRDGKMIKTVIQSLFMSVEFYMNKIRVTPTGSDNIPFHQVRVIVFTCDFIPTPNAVIADFFNVDTTVDGDPATYQINRSIVTVIKDRTYYVQNPMYWNPNTPSTQAIVPKPVCAIRIMKSKRRWNQLSFPTENSTVPNKRTAQTYVACIPRNIVQNNISNASVGISLVCKTYYTDN